MKSKHLLNQAISNFPSRIWFEAISSEDFNDANSEMAPAVPQAAHAVSTAADGRRAQQLATAQQDHGPKVAA